MGILSENILLFSFFSFWDSDYTWSRSCDLARSLRVRPAGLRPSLILNRLFNKERGLKLDTSGEVFIAFIFTADLDPRQPGVLSSTFSLNASKSFCINSLSERKNVQ